MMLLQLHSMRDEMLKIAAVRGPVKMYRRALQALEGGHNFHGVRPKDVEALASSGRIDPNPGMFGRGAYMWKELPLSTYMDSPTSSGVVMARKALGSLKPPTKGTGLVDRKSQLLRPHMEISQESVPIPAKSLFVAPPEQLSLVRRSLKEHRMRPIDSAIFHRAEADKRVAHHFPSMMHTPSKKELLDMASRKKKPASFKPEMRGHTDDVLDSFLDKYEAATARSAAGA